MKKLMVGILFLFPVSSWALNYNGLNTLAKDQNLQGRVVYAFESASIAVMNESSGTVAHAQRIQFATHILSGGLNPYIFTLSTLTNTTIAGEANPTNVPDFSIPDGDIQFSVNSIFNSMAGIPAQ